MDIKSWAEEIQRKASEVVRLEIELKKAKEELLGVTNQNSFIGETLRKSIILSTDKKQDKEALNKKKKYYKRYYLKKKLSRLRKESWKNLSKEEREKRLNVLAQSRNKYFEGVRNSKLNLQKSVK